MVFDCMIYVQALARPNGPAAACLDKATAGECELLVSVEVLAEVHEVLGRPKLRRTFIRASDDDVEAFMRRLDALATNIDPVPEAFTLLRDPKDSMYLNLAIAGDAKLVVSRDNDLLDLMSEDSAEGNAFRTGYPEIAILDPVAFLRTFPADPPATEPKPTAPPPDEAS